MHLLHYGPLALFFTDVALRVFHISSVTKKDDHQSTTVWPDSQIVRHVNESSHVTLMDPSIQQLQRPAADGDRNPY